MQQQIPRKRHLTVSDCTADLTQQPKAVIGRVILPPRQIHVRTGLLNVAGNHPGDRCDMTIPGPFGLLRVTVLARSLDDGQRFWIDPRLTENSLVASGSAERTEGMNQGTARGSDCGDARRDENVFDHLTLLLLICPTTASSRQ